jgi:hypothetical protein
VLEVPSAGITVAAPNPSVPQSIIYPNFSSTAGLNLVSTFGVVSNALYLTNTTSNDVGNVWMASTSTYNRNFSVEWVFEVGGGGGADGFCLQWHTSKAVMPAAFPPATSPTRSPSTPSGLTL